MERLLASYEDGLEKILLLDVEKAELAVAICDGEKVFVDVAPLVKPVLYLYNVADLVHFILVLVIHLVAPDREQPEVDALLLDFF